MSEFIVDLSDVEKTSDRFKMLFSESIPLKNKIVRCGDCFWFDDYNGKCHRPATVIDVDGNVFLTDEENGYMSMTDAEPNGFCAWGERKVGRMAMEEAKARFDAMVSEAVDGPMSKPDKLKAKLLDMMGSYRRKLTGDWATLTTDEQLAESFAAEIRGMAEKGEL